MVKVLRWGTCALLLFVAVAFSPILGQQAFAQTTLNASNVEDAVLTLEDDTVLNMDTNLKLTSIVSDEYDLTIKGEGTLQVSNKNEAAIDVAKLKISDELEVAEPEDAKVSKGTVVNKEGKPASTVVISVAAPVFKADPPEGENTGNDQVTVTFDVQGHGVTPEAVSVESGSAVSKPADPSETCYSFEGWFTESSCTTEYDFSKPVTSSITLYAKWTSNHALEHVAAKEATCAQPGNIEYWQCADCGKCFKTAAAADADEISPEETVVTKGHTLSHYTATSATCTAAGNIEYWHCTDCGKYFKDENAQTAIQKADTVVKALGHQLTHTKAKAATCTKAGNREYWTCSRCGKLFSNASGTTSISKVPTVAKTGHKWGKWQIVKEATTTEKGLRKRVCQHNSKHVQKEDIPMLIAYTFDKGANSSWTKGTKTGLEMIVKRNVDDDTTFDLFKSLSIDDKVVDSNNYTTAKGSLKLTLKDTYLENMSVGSHKVKFTFEDGEANTTLTIKAKDGNAASGSSASGNGSTTARTSDQIPVGVIVGIALVAVAALAGVFVARRRMNS